MVFLLADAEAFQEAGKPSILVRWETTPDDLKGMVAAAGILTSHGGKTSHAAVIARGMGAPASAASRRSTLTLLTRSARLLAPTRCPPRR